MESAVKRGKSPSYWSFAEASEGRHSDGTAVIGATLSSMTPGQGREHILLGISALGFSLSSPGRAELTHVLFRGVRLGVHTGPASKHH